MSKRGSYGKPARPFEICNIGNYESVYWQGKQDKYLAFMLKLYQSQPLIGFRYLHGRKRDRAVHVGPLNAPVTMEEVEKVIKECRTNNFNTADVLGWEWSYEVVNELSQYIKFPEVAYLEIETGVKGIEVTLKITDFQLPSTAELADIASKVEDSMNSLIAGRLIGIIKAIRFIISGRVSG